MFSRGGAYRDAMTDPLDAISIDACPECGTVLQDGRCRGCGYAREVPHVERPKGGDELPGIYG